MSNDSNQENSNKADNTSFEDFFENINVFGRGKGESEAQVTAEIPLFANRTIPEDILKTVQEAMREQESRSSEKSLIPANPVTSDSPELDSARRASALAVAQMQAQTQTRQAPRENEAENSLKISKVRFIDNLPRKKTELENSIDPNPNAASLLTAFDSNNSSNNLAHNFKAEAIDQPRPATSSQLSRAFFTGDEKDSLSLVQDVHVMISNSPAEEKPQASRVDARNSDTRSFREEIMARLRAETESYTQVDNHLAQPQPSPTTLNPSPSSSASLAASPTKENTSQIPSKEDFLAAAGAVSSKNRTRSTNLSNPKKTSNQFEATPSRSERVQDSDRSEQKAKKNKNNKSKVHLGRSIAIIIVLGLLALGGFGYVYVQGSLKAVNPSDKTAIVVDIPTSTTAKGVADILKKDGLIKDSTVFTFYTKIKGLSNFKSGYYTLNKAMDVTSLATALEKGGAATSPAEGKITIPEGYTIDQMAVAMTVNAASKSSAKTPFSQADFLAVIKDPTFIAQMAAKYPQLFANLPAADSGVKYQLEGYLFPATYDYTATTTVKSLVEQMISAMNQKLQPYYSQMAALNLNVNQYLSLAALIEKEANTEADRKNVADVFLKRIADGMTLDSNVALLYAAGKLGSNVSLQEDANVDTSSSSPYNLYTNQGTGPGPVDNPSAMSLDALANHTTNPYYYFIADSTGNLHFATTLDEQEANKAQYLSSTSSSSSQ